MDSTKKITIENIEKILKKITKSRLHPNSLECETNNLRLLIGYLVHIFHFKNVHYININHTFKVKTMNEISLSKIVVYSFHIPLQNYNKFFERCT